jgi:hypothetical protein
MLDEMYIEEEGGEEKERRRREKLGSFMAWKKNSCVRHE